MAVYKRSYKSYTGTLTDPRLRFLILPKYSYERLFASRFLTASFPWDALATSTWSTI
jgi:hypothetical protein